MKKYRCTTTWQARDGKKILSFERTHTHAASSAKEAVALEMGHNASRRAWAKEEGWRVVSVRCDGPVASSTKTKAKAKAKGVSQRDPNEHRAHRTLYKVSVAVRGADKFLRTWGPYSTREEALEAIAMKREEARRKGWGDLTFSLREPTENWGTAGPLRRS